MKILLTGASGQLGQEWKQWAEREAKIELFPFTSSQLDITSRDQLLVKLQEVQPDIVVNCAAFTNVDGAELKQDLANQVNAEAVAYLAELSAELGCKVVHYSTDYIFAGSEEDRKQYPDGYLEDAAVDPINTYGRTKWEGEKAIGDATSDYLILRLSWVCGQFGGNFVKTMLQLGRERDQLQVVNDQWGSPTYTENVVHNTLALLKAEEQGIYNITSEGMISWYDFAEAIFELSDIDVNLEPVTSDAFPTEAERPHFSKLSTKKLQAVPGAEVINWRTGLQALLSQLQNR